MTANANMCNCATMCRIPDIEAENGRWPIPRHAPFCNEYKEERFVRQTYDGAWCILEPGDAEDMVANSSEEYQTEDVFLTRDQFDALPEFSGF